MADDPTDDAEIRLIRTHLAEEADRFAAGDFGDPAEVHGEEMPSRGERWLARWITLRRPEPTRLGSPRC